jgi:hypothetical protein
MATKDTGAPVRQATPKTEQPAWYDSLIDLFKKLLQTSNFTYGTKKKF